MTDIQPQVVEYHGSSQPHWIGNHLMMQEEPQNSGILHISSRSLTIDWGNDNHFWQWIHLSNEDSIFQTGAELLQVNWIRVSQKLDLAKLNLVPSIIYQIYYVVKFKVDAFGWHSAPITFKVKEDGKQPTSDRIEILETYKKNPDVWHEILCGQFSVPGDKIGTVEFGMYEVDTEWWKGGMVIEGVKLKLICESSSSKPIPKIFGVGYMDFGSPSNAIFPHILA